VAAAASKATGVDAEIVVGGRGEFTVWVDDKQVAQKTQSDDEIVEAVARAVRGA
jgi:hypothetical protein